MSANRWIADFDSSTAMLRAVAICPRGRDLPLMTPRSPCARERFRFGSCSTREASADALEQYLASRPRFDAIDVTLFSHGVNSIGLVPLSRWAEIRKRSAEGGDLFGVDPRTFPRTSATSCATTATS